MDVDVVPPQGVAPPEKSVLVGRSHVRLVEVNDSLDFTCIDAKGAEVRFRVALLPNVKGGIRINVKGLNCFVVKDNARPTPAVVADTDGHLAFISSTRAVLGEISWSFGKPMAEGELFVIDGEQLVVPYREASHAVAVHLGPDRELVVMCRRP
jgi:hypothetical protein